MGRRSLEEFESLIAFEVRRTGWVPGLDPEDVTQELRAHVAMKCLPKIKGNTGRTFVRTSVRNALANLKRAATTASRMPRDRRGKMVPPLTVDFASVYGDETPSVSAPSAPGASPEQQAETNDKLRLLDEKLSPTERELLMRAFIDGVVARGDERKVAKAKARARSVLSAIVKTDDLIENQHRVTSDDVRDGNQQKEKPVTDLNMIPKTPEENLPPCHAHGEDPVGYETDLAEAQDCQDCPDKFSCLALSIDEGLIEATLDIDPEVAAVLGGDLEHKAAAERIARRQQIRENGGAIPDDLLFNNIPDGDEEEEPEEEEVEEEETTEAADEGEEEMTEEMTEETPKKKPKKKAAPKKAAPKKAAPKKAAPKKKAPPKKKAAPKKAAPKKKAPKVSVLKSGKVKVDGKVIGEVAEEEDGWGWWSGDDESPDWLDSKDAAVADLVKAKAPKGSKSNGKKKRRSSVDVSGLEVGTILDDGRMVCPSNRLAPAPKELNKEQMARALDRTKLGLPFDIGPGMKLTQHRRDGDKIEITITSKGFKYDGDTYSSLTAACMRALCRSVSGNEMFNFEKSSNIEISGKGVPNGSFTRNDVE